MPRVLHSFTVRGSAFGPATSDEIILEFVMLDDGSCAGTVVAPPHWSLENPSASIDLVKTMVAGMPVYLCRFTVVHWDSGNAVRGEVEGRLTQANGLVGSYAVCGQHGSQAVHLLPVNSAVGNEPDLSSATIADEEESDDQTEDDGVVTVETLFRGEQRDSNGKKYATTLLLAKALGDTQIHGYTREGLRKSQIKGTWKADQVRFRLAYSLKSGVVYYYDYAGTVTHTVSGTKLKGTWQFAGGSGNQQAYDSVLTGTFDLTRDDRHVQTTRNGSQARQMVP